MTTLTLTEREQSVIRLAAEGFTGQEIGERLFISTAAVNKRLGSIYCKLGARNITHAVALAIGVGSTSDSTATSAT